MNCFDCAAAGRVSTAVAVCHDCGAAVCAEHAISRDDHLTRTVTISRKIVVEPPARLVRCRVCTAAHDAVVRESDTRTHGWHHAAGRR